MSLSEPAQDGGSKKDGSPGPRQVSAPGLQPSPLPADLLNTTTSNLAAWMSNANAPVQNTDDDDEVLSSSAVLQHPAIPHFRKPSDAGLHLQTDTSTGDSVTTISQLNLTDDVFHAAAEATQGDRLQASPPKKHRPPFLTRRSFEVNASLSSPPSSVSSPMLAALGDVTPLPSPIGASIDPGIWRKSSVRSSRSRGSSSASMFRDDVPSSASNLLSPAMSAASPPQFKKKKQYPNLGAAAIDPSQQDAAGHGRNRSTSEFIPEALQNIRPRHVTVPGVIAPDSEKMDTPDSQLHREEYLADRKRKPSADVQMQDTFPTPPSSDLSTAEQDEGQKALEEQFGQLKIKSRHSDRIRSWKPLRILGQGAFSQVVLASSLASGGTGNLQELVAIKIVSHDLEAGSDEERMETSIKREIEMLKAVSHPCLPQMKSFDDGPERALLVLNYCPGGDLFEMASQQRHLLTPTVIQRVFRELVEAVHYLHIHFIVHRDIKLENVLFNVTTSTLQDLSKPQEYSHPLITLTDLGLSRRIPPPPASPLLSHACGSADYAAPELLLGQPYDGRATDAWALGVLLYSLLEGRLPFDPLPGKRNTGNVKHRIARCDWLWCEYGDQWGDWVEDSAKGREMAGARRCVEGLLKKVGRGRWGLDQVMASEWVKEGISVKSGLKVDESQSFSRSRMG